MAFDENAYTRDFIRPLRGAPRLPDNLLDRYAVTLSMTDAEIVERVEAVRRLWNKSSRGATSLAQVFTLCRAADETLRRDVGEEMLTRQFWTKRQSEQDAASGAAIAALAQQLKENYGRLGVVTRGLLDRAAERTGLTSSQADGAAAQAKLSVLEAIELPTRSPLDKYRDLIGSMVTCGAPSVLHVVHPDGAPFTIAERFTSTKDPLMRLDVAAVEVRQREMDRRGRSLVNDAAITALRILAEGLRKGVDLRELALYHFRQLIEPNLQIGAPFAVDALVEAGLDARDAAVLVLSVLATGTSGTDSTAHVAELLAAGCLDEAAASLNAVPMAHPERASVEAQVKDARAQLESLLAKAAAAAQAGHEQQAEDLLRQAAAISAAHAERQLQTLALPPPGNVRLAADEGRVQLFWQPAQGHQEQAVEYVVARTTRRAPVGPGDGTEVYRGSTSGCPDERAPVARKAFYAVFATVAGRPHSRPALADVTLLPPPSRLEAEVSPGEVHLRWVLHPEARSVSVQRRDPAGRVHPEPAQRSDCRVSGLADGQTQQFEVRAVYEAEDGGVVQSAPAHKSAVPRAEARPVRHVSARSVVAGGVPVLWITWTPVDASPVTVRRGAQAPSWAVGSVLDRRAMEGFGDEVQGERRETGGQTTLDCDPASGIHHLVLFSEGASGFVVGTSAAVGVTRPVRNLMATPFSTYAVLSWEWPDSTHLAEVTRTADGEETVHVVGQAEYRSAGGVRVPLGRTATRIEVRAVLVTEGRQFTSAPVSATVTAVVTTTVSYTVSRPPTALIGGRRRTVAFQSPEGCSGARVRVVAVPGRVMPTDAGQGLCVLERDLALEPGIPEEHEIELPRSLRRPYWLRCFLLAGPVKLVDPPVTNLKES